jgi:hypothetical protein
MDLTANIQKLFLGSDDRLQWETLLTGGAAVLAALFTIRKINEQIRQTGQLAADQRNRKARAARAMLPLALSEITEYATACINGLLALQPLFLDESALDRSPAHSDLSSWTLPRLPENVLPLLKECIEYSDDRPAEAMRDMVRHFQVQNTRLIEDLSRLRLNDGVHLLLWQHIVERIQDSAELCARAAILFPFSRGSQPQDFDIDRSHIYSALVVTRSMLDLGKIEALADGWQREFHHRSKMQQMGF